jgi:hypothetical protein
MKQSGRPSAVRRFRAGRITALETLVLCAAGLILVAILFPVLGRRPDPGAGRLALCGRRLRSLEQAVQLYAQDNGDTFPPANTWQEAIAPYARDARLFICPSRRSKRPGYAYNVLMHHRSTASVRSPERQPVLFESRLGSWNANGRLESFVRPHEGTGGVAFAGGEVQYLPAAPPADAGLPPQGQPAPLRRKP